MAYNTAPTVTTKVTPFFANYKGHFFVCPLVTYRNPNAAEDTPKAFGTSYATFLTRIQALKDDTHVQVLGGGYQGIKVARAKTLDPDDEPLPFPEVLGLPGSGGLK